MKTKNKKIKPSTNLVKFGYYIEGYSLRQLGELFGVSRETIRKLIDDKSNKNNPTKRKKIN